MKPLATLAAAVFVTGAATLSTAAAPQHGGSCPGCTDQSSAVAVNTCLTPSGIFAGMSVIKSSNSGECWVVHVAEDACEESFPCTPHITVYVVTTEPAKVETEGEIGQTGVGGGQYSHSDPNDFLRIYSDFTSVGCGRSVNWWFGAILDYADGTSCNVSASGTFVCSSCSQG